MIYRLFLITALLFYAIPSFADLHPQAIVKTVDATNAAERHNNLGNIYFKDKDLFAAIKEYRIAIALNPNSQTTATYFNNLGKVYYILGEIQIRNGLPLQGWDDFSVMAQISFEEAIKKDCMKIEYYKNLVKIYELRGVLESKKEQYLKDSEQNPFNVIPAALILEKQGDIQRANMLLDDFTTKNPDLIITDDLKKIIKQNIKKDMENL